MFWGHKSILVSFFLIIAAHLLHAQDVVSGKYDNLPQVQLLSKYVQYPSYSGQEYSAGKFFMNACKEKGLHVEVFTDTGGSINFAASLYPLDTKKPNIVLHHHIDVVEEGTHENWKYPPFSGTIADGYVWGRGALDIKGMGVMHLFALASFVEMADTMDLPYNFTLLAVSGEETGGHLGAAIIVEHFAERLNPVLVLGEGGSGASDLLMTTPERPYFGISIAEKVSLWLRLSINMETLAHGSVTPGEYPVQVMINALTRIDKRIPQIKFNKASRRMFRELGKIERGPRGFLLQNINWLIFRPLVAQYFLGDPNLYALTTNTITITSICTPELDHNQIAQSVEATLDCRLITSSDKDDLLKEIKELIRDPRIKIEVVEKGSRSYISTPEKYYNLMSDAIKSFYPKSVVVPIFFPASTDNNYFRGLGIPVYGINPFIKNKELLNSIHNYNERMPVEGLIQGQKVYELFIQKVIKAHGKDDTQN